MEFMDINFDVHDRRLIEWNDDRGRMNHYVESHLNCPIYGIVSAIVSNREFPKDIPTEILDERFDFHETGTNYRFTTTPLLFAIRFGCYEQVEYLLNLGADATLIEECFREDKLIRRRCALSVADDGIGRPDDILELIAETLFGGRRNS